MSVMNLKQLQFARDSGKFKAGDAVYDNGDRAIPVTARLEADGDEAWVVFVLEPDVAEIKDGVDLWDLWVPIDSLEVLIRGANGAIQSGIMVKCKSCRYFGQHWSKPGLQGYCIKLTKDVDGSKPMCKEFDTWKSSSPSSQS